MAAHQARGGMVDRRAEQGMTMGDGVIPVAAAPRSIALVPMFTVTLVAGALVNGFPLVFPDSGTYLGIAFGPEYAIDRSSVYGLLLKPLVGLLPGAAGLWLAIVVQAALVAAVLAAAAAVVPRPSRALWLLAPLLLLTSLPWHAGQFMPDAFTGVLVLLVWLAATRNPRAPGAAILWLAAILLAMTHYTHVVLLGTVAAVTILVDALIAGRGSRAWRARAAAALVATIAPVALLTAANMAVLHQAKMSPLGPLFLFARLNEDGLVPAWMDRHCGRDAPAPLCAERNRIAHNSQVLLWRDADGIVSRHIWRGSDAERWAWVAMLDVANKGAIRERPLAFLASSARAAARQFISFAPLDDECPANCRSTVSGIGYSLARYRPSTVPLLYASMQGQGTLPKTLLRWIITPIAAVSILLLPVVLIAAWRRRDAAIATLIAVTGAALLVNAAMAGALSDVHDRYQSRIVWLAPFVLALAWLRRRAEAR